ncbi:SWIM-type domain-containing protein [Citrus sinensis]|uniref:SWIM-type domain-containing protein n=1 Tax=Citrus sinensis TaxID=2711 RepID=A0ACB8KF94_CITSI|nr:SWIM-type domain-containing protein [Citrus sinensis]
MVKYGHNEMDLIEIFVVLPWTTSRQRKLISNDSEFCHVIEFEVHTGLGGQSCHESVVIGSENPVNIGVSMGSDKFEKLSEDGFIGGHLSDEENVSLKVGNTFESVALLKEVMVKYAIQEGFELNRIKNDGVRYIKGKHDCQIKSINKDATAPWIAKVCAGLIQTNPGVGVNVIRSADHIACYGKLLKYAHILMKMNRGACVKVKVKRPLSNSPVFQRFFLSFPALKVGYLTGCRPFIGLDGCHLKGPYRGVLLSAVALDDDSGIFPLAFCICEVENYDSWSYFLSLLYEFIGADDHRHIFANLKCKFPGLNVMGLFWKACRAANQYDFERAMSQIRAKDQNCYEWLRKIPPAQWSRSGFDHHVKSDHVTNNMTESFNKWVDEVRDKPVLTILEHIRRQLMVRIERLNQSSNEARRIKVFGGRGELFECCQAGYRNILVHITDGTCECGMWQVSGVPCKHAVAAILHKGGQPENYVHHYLTKESFMMTYMGTINPIPDECAWPEVEAEPSPDVVVPVKVGPPDIKAPVGRPKKKRTKEPGETKLTSKRFTIKCSACRCLGHNKRGCPNFPKTTRTIEGSNRTSSSAQASDITSSTAQHGTNPQSQEVDVNDQSIGNSSEQAS